MVRFGISGPAGKISAALAAIMMALLASVAPALADLRICNQTLNLYNVAMGSYSGPHCDQNDPQLHSACQFETQGWWNLPANGCISLIKKSLELRYYYVFALDVYGNDALTGERPLCVNVTKGFDIRTPYDDTQANTPECWQRGYQEVKFKEIDVGGASDWTVFINQGGGG